MQITFSDSLQKKINHLKQKMIPVKLGRINFDSPLLLAPMSAICNAPYRYLMEELGAGGTISELISCNGIKFTNSRTQKLLEISPLEKNVGIQLFGDDPEILAMAAKVAQESGPKFIDINMGCPVKKVVTRGAGSALLKDPSKLGVLFSTIKKAIDIPLTIKIRTGWDEESLNAQEVIRIANEEGIEFVSIHGRTRTQAYKGHANWDYIENVALNSPLPVIGNGDLSHEKIIKSRLSKTNCKALMLGRGPLRDPFIFLKSYDQENEIQFSAKDYLEVIEKLLLLLGEYHGMERERVVMIQMRKFIVWISMGFSHAVEFRERIFKTPDPKETFKITQDFFLTHGDGIKKLDMDSSFISSTHG
ncbi:MAG: tRNA dihydrouridine synthase [Bacteriovoracales bacterium]